MPFLRTGVFVLLAGFAVETLAAMLSINPVDSVEIDVLVVGAGSAGVPGAIQAGRLGAKTVLVESAPILGGNLTLGGVEHPEAFMKPGGVVAVAGIGLEWTVKSIELGKGPALSMNARDFVPERLNLKRAYDPNTFVCVGEELLAKAGVDLRYYESPIKVEPIAGPAGHRWRVFTAAQGEVREIRCKQIVDCTGNGTVAKMCGAAFLPVDGERQGASFNYGIQGAADPSRLSEGTVQARWDEAMRTGALKDGDNHGGDVGPLQIFRWVGSNYIWDADSSTARTRTRSNIEARKSAMRVLRFHRSIPGGEKARFAWMSPEVGIRETNRVRGRYVLTAEDYMAGRTWPDSICFSVYHIDMHMHRWKDFVRMIPKTDVYPTIPFRCLLPEGVDNLLVAGRCLSADRKAFAAIRLCAPAMATGQAAGAAAALSALSGCRPSDLDIGRLRDVLARHGQRIPGGGEPCASAGSGARQRK